MIIKGKPGDLIVYNKTPQLHHKRIWEDGSIIRVIEGYSFSEFEYKLVSGKQFCTSNELKDMVYYNLCPGDLDFYDIQNLVCI